MKKQLKSAFEWLYFDALNIRVPPEHAVAFFVQLLLPIVVVIMLLLVGCTTPQPEQSHPEPTASVADAAIPIDVIDDPTCSRGDTVDIGLGYDPRIVANGDAFMVVWSEEIGENHVERIYGSDGQPRGDQSTITFSESFRLAIGGTDGTFLAITATNFPYNVMITAIHRIDADGTVLNTRAGQKGVEAVAIVDGQERIAWVDSRGQDTNDIWHTEYKLGAICDDAVCEEQILATTADVFPWMHGMAAIGDIIAIGIMYNPSETPRDREIGLLISHGTEAFIAPLAFGVDLPALAVRHVFADGDHYVVHWMDGRDRSNLKQFLTLVTPEGTVGEPVEIAWAQSMATGSRRLGAVITGPQGGTMFQLLSRAGQEFLVVPFAGDFEHRSGYPQIAANLETYAIIWGERVDADGPLAIKLQLIYCTP